MKILKIKIELLPLLVLIALLVTSSANVIGMMQIILKNLFPNRDKKK